MKRFELDVEHVGPSLVRQELRQLLRLAVPAIVTSCSTMAMTATDQIMVGHLGRDALAAASIGNTWYNLMIFFQLGFSTALDTQGAQAYGAGDTKALRACLVTALVLGSVAALPMVAALLVTRPVAIALFRQPPAMADSAAQFCARLAPGVIPQMIGVYLIKYLQAQNQMVGPAVLSVVAVVVNVGLNLLLIRHLGFLGAPLATTLSRALFCIAAAALVAYSNTAHSTARSTDGVTYPLSNVQKLQQISGATSNSDAEELLCVVHGEPSTEPAALYSTVAASESGCLEAHGAGGVNTLSIERQLQDPPGGQVGGMSVAGEGMLAAVRAGLTYPALASFLKLAVPGGMMLALESSSFDVTTAFAGMLGVAQVDAHVAMLTVVTFNFMSFPYGISVAATIRVGNLLGSGRPAAARASAWCALALGAAAMAACAAAMLVLRGRLTAIFIDDAVVHRLVRSVVLIGATQEVLDGIMGTAQGVLRGAGKQARVLLYNLAGFWGVGVASGVLMTFGFGWGLRGLWAGIVLGVGTTAALSTWGVYRLDWTAAAAAAQDATGQGGGPAGCGGVNLLALLGADDAHASKERAHGDAHSRNAGEADDESIPAQFAVHMNDHGEAVVHGHVELQVQEGVQLLEEA